MRHNITARNVERPAKIIESTFSAANSIWILKTALADGEEKLQAAGVTDSAKLDAEILLAFVLGKPRSYLHAWPEYALTSVDMTCYAAQLARRVAGEPIAYIVGEKEFWSMSLTVSKNTLIPRPDTEVLVVTALQLAPQDAAWCVADLGTGSGAIALAFAKERPHWQIVAADISAAALAVAKSNAEKFNFKNIIFREGNWCDVLMDRKLDMIVSNPPYIALDEWGDYADGLRYEPASALLSGADGLQAIRMLIHSAKYYLKPEGYLVLEHGLQQGEAVRSIMAHANYNEINTVPGLMGEERVTVGRV